MKRQISLFVVAAFLCCAWGPCATRDVIAPITNVAKQPSFDGNKQNSGVIRRNPDGSRDVTAHLRDRYNALIDSYGDQIGITAHDAGLTVKSEQEWTIDEQHYTQFLRMNQWRRDGRQKTGMMQKLIRKL